MFGAKAEIPESFTGDVSQYADQTIAFQNAIDFIAQYGGKVLVPSCNNNAYLCKGTITLKKGVTLSGCGTMGGVHPKWKGMIYHKPPKNTISLFQLEPLLDGDYVYGITIENLTFYSKNSNCVADSNYCFDFTNHPGNVTIRNCHIYGFQTGLYINGGIWNRFENLAFSWPLTNAIHIGGPAVTTVTRFDHCAFEGGQICVVIESSISAWFHDCIFESSKFGAMEVYEGTLTSLFACYTEDISESIFQIGHTALVNTKGEPTIFSMFGCNVAGKNDSPDLTNSIGLDLDSVSATTIIGCHFARVAFPIKTSNKTQRVDYFGNTCVQVGLNPWNKIYDRRRFIGEMFGNIVPNVFPSQHLYVPDIRLATFPRPPSEQVVTTPDYRIEAVNFIGNNLIVSGRDGQIIQYVRYDGDDQETFRGRRQVDAPVFVNTKKALTLDQLNQSPSDDDWISGSDDDFSATGKYSWIPVGGFSMAKDSSTGVYYLVVKTGDNGKRQKVAVNQ